MACQTLSSVDRWWAGGLRGEVKGGRPRAIVTRQEAAQLRPVPSGQLPDGPSPVSGLAVSPLASPGSWRHSPQSRGLLALRCLGPAGLGDPKGTPCPGWPGLVLVGTWCLGTILNSIPSLSRVWVWTPAEAHSSHGAPTPGQADGPSDATGASLSLAHVLGAIVPRSTLKRGP